MDHRHGAAVLLGLVFVLGAVLLQGPTRGWERPLPVIRPALEPRAGVFLVAPLDMPDPRFARAVVLLVEHGPAGSVGLIVNRVSEFRVAELLPDFADVARDHPLWFGGPVAPYTVSFLLRSATPPPGTVPVLEELHYGRGLATLKDLLEEGVGPRDLHVFLGYAGWGPGQLDAELRNGDWILMPASTEEAMAPKDLWERLLERREPTGVPVYTSPVIPGGRQTVGF